MPRPPRLIVPGIGHHITQRGTGRQIVFYSRSDRLTYLALLRENCRKASVRILAYCLLQNHIHLVAVPRHEDSLAVAMRRAHGRYAQYFNARKLRSGHLWQNRFYSCPLGPSHLWAALAYVELNPVRAGLVDAAADYEWSSAAAHLTGEDRHRVVDMEFWRAEGGANEWRRLLAEGGDPESNRQLVRATHAGKPLGTREFVDAVTQRQTSSAPVEGAAASWGDALRDTARTASVETRAIGR